MKRFRTFCVGIGLLVSFTSLLYAQEDIPPAGGGRGGRAGGRGGRGGGGRGGTREFLGLGPAPDEAAAAKGAPLYKQNCATCHGETARGAQAPSLVRSVLVLHDEKAEEIGPVIKNGRPQGGMPAFANLSQDDVYNISQFIHLQVELAANRGTYGTTYGSLRNQVTGDPKKGEEFFNGAGGCKNCHSVTGDLAKIGAKFGQSSAMQSRFLWPTTPGPLKATVTPPSGPAVTGTVRVLNDFDVAITDSAGEYHYWPRGQVQVQVEDKLAGHRALLPKYTDADIHNLTAYLVTLK
ncbi:MAG TPA: c-type cytochrome [Bryobacteraceae bacterium]|nr:c-type cytochrome [Bryobacteraceae bacterium]